MELERVRRDIIVIENGSFISKVGYSTDQIVSVFCTVIGISKSKIKLNPMIKHVLVGNKAYEERGVRDLFYPIQNGIIVDWNNMEKIWHYTFYEYLKVDPEDYSIVLTEVALNPKANRERMIKIMFETFKFKSCSVAIESVLALYHSSKESGVVVKFGESLTKTVPVYEGYCIFKAIERGCIGENDLLRYMRDLLSQKGHTNLYKDKEILEKCTHVALDYENEINSKSFIYYDNTFGVAVHLSYERFQSLELIFKPSMVGLEKLGIHELLYSSIINCDLDMRNTLLKNIFIVEGSLPLKKIAQRLRKEMIMLFPKSKSIIKVTNPFNSKLSIWGGGNKFAMNSNFDDRWVTKEEYIQYGSSIIHKKCN